MAEIRPHDPEITRMIDHTSTHGSPRTSFSATLGFRIQPAPSVRNVPIDHNWKGWRTGGQTGGESTRPTVRVSRSVWSGGSVVTIRCYRYALQARRVPSCPGVSIYLQFRSTLPVERDVSAPSVAGDRVLNVDKIRLTSHTFRRVACHGSSPSPARRGAASK